jgi:hypothetical protein
MAMIPKSINRKLHLTTKIIIHHSIFCIQI